MKTCANKLRKFSKVGSVMNLYLRQYGWRSARNCENWNDFFKLLNRKSPDQARAEVFKLANMMHRISINWMHRGERKQVPKEMAMGLILDVCDEVDRINSIV